MLSIEHKEVRPETVVITIKGRMMLGADSQQLEARVSQLVEQGTRTIVFDLTELTHIDSTGIGRFIASYHVITAKGGAVKMASATNPVRSAFRVTRLDSVFPFFDSVDAALSVPA